MKGDKSYGSYKPVMARLMCWWSGHKRRVRVPVEDVIGGSAVYIYLRCPRCLDLSGRKARKATVKT